MTRVSPSDGALCAWCDASLVSERKNLNLLNNKTLRVRRVFHPEANTILYVSYSTRTASTGNDKDGGQGRDGKLAHALFVHSLLREPLAHARALTLQGGFNRLNSTCISLRLNTHTPWTCAG